MPFDSCRGCFMIGDPFRVELRCNSVLVRNPVLVLVRSELVLVLSGTVLVLVIEPVLAPSNPVLVPSNPVLVPSNPVLVLSGTVLVLVIEPVPVLLIEPGLFFSNVVSIMTFLST